MSYSNYFNIGEPFCGLMLFCHLQPVPPSPVAARKISFNGLKETIVLPQQAGESFVNYSCIFTFSCFTLWLLFCNFL